MMHRFRVAVVMAVVVSGTVASFARQAAVAWMQPPAHEQQLPDSSDCWEPAIAAGSNGLVIVTAGRRTGAQRTPEFDQRLVVWRSQDGGATFATPVPITPDGRRHFDQRVAIDDTGTIYVSYSDRDRDERGRAVSRLRLARSSDGGRSFVVRTVVPRGVDDKPELGISPDGRHIYIVYVAAPGPTLVASHDGGATWGEPTVVAPSNGRHFFPEALTVARDGTVWFAVPSMPDQGLLEGKEIPTQLHVFHSADAGRTWRDSELGTFPRHPSRCVHDPECGAKASDISVAVDGTNHGHAIFTGGATTSQPFGLFHRRSSDNGTTWSSSVPVSDASRPKSRDQADHDYPIAVAGSGRLCAVWVDDRRGDLDVWARCSADDAQTWGSEVLLSDRADGAPYKSATGFTGFFGHYGGAAIGGSGRLHVAWAAGEKHARTGSVWVNSIDIAQTLRPDGNRR
jgi:hypothetical protein